MKKLMSVILSLTVVLGLVSVVPTNAAENNQDDIQSFINESRELLSYDVEPVFTTSSVEDNEYSEIDFSSCRLILKSTKKPNELNSVGIADGFKDYYIVQFENEIDAKNAYEDYLKDDCVISVGVDVEQDVLTTIEPFIKTDCEKNLVNTFELTDSEKSNVPTYDSAADSLNSWGAEITGTYAIKNYLKNNSQKIKNEVIVAVVDSGINYDHEYFSNKKERLEKTNFNVLDPTKDEYDNVNGHGTAVSSVILDSTTDNVKVRNYKLTDDNGNSTMSEAAIALLQAANDAPDVINCSFAFEVLDKTAEWQLLSDVLKEIYLKNILVVCSAGNYTNSSIEPVITLPSTSEHVLSVTGLDKSLRPTFSMGTSVDVSAPAIAIPAAYKNSYSYLSGTSLSAPLVSAVCALVYTMNSQYNVDDVVDSIKENAVPYDKAMNISDITNVYGFGFVDAIDATGMERPKSIVSNINGGKYENEINLTLTSPDGGDIYYTLHTEYPTQENSTLYTEPIKIYANQCLVTAVSYDKNGVPSKLFSDLYRSSALEDESNFEIDENGTIIKYTGSLYDIIIPETIDSIEVKNIAQSAFLSSTVTGITLPKTIKTLGDFTYDNAGPFAENEYLCFIDGDAVEEIGHEVFSGSKNLSFVNFPNCTELGDGAFELVTTITKLYLPKIEHIGIQSFYWCDILYLILPELKSCAEKAFEYGDFYYIYIPKFSFINDWESINYPAIFKNAVISLPVDLKRVEDLRKSLFDYKETETVTRIEFSNLKYLYDMPGPYSTLVLPSTLEILPNDMEEYTSVSVYGNIIDTFTVYGSSGTLVEDWAKENEVKFIEISQETAIVKDLPRYYKPYMGKLEADVIGFNRQYQWYSNEENSNVGGTPIKGATEKSFDPATYPDANYYYCEVISKDGDLDPITIKTSACENRMNVAVEEEKSCITSVTYEPSRETRNTFTVTVENRPTQVQFIEPDGGTRTYDRNHKSVTVKSYDENGNEVSSLDRTLAYEVWSIYSNMSAGVEIKARAKYLEGAVYSWDSVKYSFTVELLPPDSAVRSVTPAATSGRFGAVETTVVTGPDAEAIRFKMEDGSTSTYLASKAITLENGDLRFVGKAWMNHVGENVIKVEVKVGGKWQTATTFTYTADDYPASA